MPLMSVGRIGQPDTLTVGVETIDELPDPCEVQDFLFEQAKDSLLGVDACSLCQRLAKAVREEFPERDFFVEIMGPGQGYRVDEIRPKAFLLLQAPPVVEEASEEPKSGADEPVKD